MNLRTVGFGVLAMVAVAAGPSASRAGNGVDIHLSTQPSGLVLVGHAGAPDPIGTVTYVMIDISGTPLPFRHVTIDFSGCQDVTICSDVVDAGLEVQCATRRVVGITDAYGRVTFTVVGRGLGNSPRTLGPCAIVDLEGHRLSDLRVSAYDLDGINGVNAIDLSLFAADLFSGPYRPRSDYDFDGDVDSIDLGRFARALFGGGSSSSGVAACSP